MMLGFFYYFVFSKNNCCYFYLSYLVSPSTGCKSQLFNASVSGNSDRPKWNFLAFLKKSNHGHGKLNNTVPAFLFHLRTFFVQPTVLFCDKENI
jgi:hypothetical protein